MGTVTIYDVAEAAGVSTATVSKVLSNHPHIAASTRARVLAVVEQLNYVPNIAARGLAGARTHIIAVVISYTPDALFSDPHLLRILHGIDEEIAGRNCALLLSTAHQESDPMSAHRRLLSQHYADGALVDGSLGETGNALLRERGYPVVAIGYSEEISCVHTDDAGGARAMTEHLLALGHRRVGVISGPATDRLAMHTRLAGYHAALDGAGIPRDEALLGFGTFRSASGYHATETLMQQAEPPTAIFAFNDRMAFGAIRWLRAHGLRVPDDVSVAGFDDIPSAELWDPPLSTVRQLSQAQGREAASLLFRMIEGGTSGPREEIALPATVVLRGSTGPRSTH